MGEILYIKKENGKFVFLGNFLLIKIQQYEFNFYVEKNTNFRSKLKIYFNIKVLLQKIEQE